MKIFIFLFTVLFASCQCIKVDCVPGPPDLTIQLVDITGSDPILSGSLKLENVALRNIQKQIISTPQYHNLILRFTIDNTSSDYVLVANNIIVDTLIVTTLFIEGECCSIFTINNVTINDKQVEFRPFLKMEI